MATAEYDDKMSNVEQIENQQALDRMRELHSAAKKIHVGDLQEIEQFKSIMDKLMAIEKDLTLIKKHFNIVHLIG